MKKSKDTIPEDLIENTSLADTVNDTTQDNAQDEVTNESLLQKIEVALNTNANFTEQIRLSLLALNEILHSHKLLEENYAFLIEECGALLNELESKKGSLDAKANEYLNEFKTLLENARLLNEQNTQNTELSTQNLEQSKTLRTECEEILREITKKALEFETQLEFLKQVSEVELPKIEGLLDDINSKTDEINALFESKKEETINSFKTLASEALQKATELKESFFNEINTARDEFLQKQSEINEDLNLLKSDIENKQNEALSLIDEKINSFDKKYTSIKYLSPDEPQDNATRLNDIWLDTKNGILRTFVKNPLFSHFGTTYPDFLAKRSDLWVNDLNELFCLREDVDLNLDFLKVNEVALEAKFKQNAQPDLSEASLGDIWFKCQPFEVYYLENKSWVQIHQKLVRFKQESEPIANEGNVIEINDIWQNTTNNLFYIYANISKEEGDTKEWIQLGQAFNYTKFKGPDFPEIANDESEDVANKALMRDLYFKCDESEIYICLDENGTKFFKKVSLAKEEAKYKQSTEPKPLKENVLVFKNESDDENEDGFYKGVVYAYKPQNYEDKWLRLSYLKKNAHFNDNDTFEISTKYARAYDIWYKEKEDKVFIFLPKSKEANSIFEWKEIDVKTPSFLHTSTEEDRQDANLGSVYFTSENDENPLIFTKKGINLEYKEMINEELLEREIKPFWWYNSLLKDLFVRVKKVDYRILKLEKDLNANLQALDLKHTNENTTLQTNINALATKHDYAYKSLATNAVAIDFRTANNFKLTLTTANKVISSVSVAGCEGKTGLIYIQGANFITSFSAPFNFRIAQSGFGSWELFSYAIINGVIRLVRS